MASPSEITGLSICIENTDAQIDAALDAGDRRAFMVWTKRRASLIARREKAVFEVATTEVRT